MTDSMHRFALYFAPDDDTELAAFGRAVLGRSAAEPRVEDSDGAHPDKVRWLSLTASPAHYGFHATLKAPFELVDGCTRYELRGQVAEFASLQAAIPLEQLSPRSLADFAALTLADQPEALTGLAQQVVDTFEPFRRPLSESDMQRRLRQPLSTRQRELLERYGYPYVAEEFRFHMTLSGPLGGQDQDFLHWLQQQYREHVLQTPVLDRLAIYGQPDRQSPFVELYGYHLGA